MRSARLTSLAVLLSAACGGADHADLVIRHATVVTMDSATPRAGALAVRDGRIVFVGNDSAVARFIGRRTRVLDLPGRMVMPGFVDTHVHPVTGGIELGECDLNAVQTRAALLAAVAACDARDTTSTWIRGGGWQLPLLPGGRAGAALLDSLVPSRPAYLTSADGHSAWVNTRALEIAGITRATRDPPNGRIERDGSGAPLGTLRESAMDLVSRHIPERTDAEYLAGLRRGLAMAARFGITTLHEADADDRVLRAWHTADSMGLLTARVVVALHVDPDSGAGQVRRLDSLRRRYAGGPLLRIAAAKIYVDGVIEGQTAALLQPYRDRPGWRGELNLPPARLDSLVHALDSAGFKVHLHVIGDRAIRVAFDAFAAQRARDGSAGPRHIMAHLQLFDPADIPRFAALGLVASFQPLWAYNDSYMRDLTVPRLGPARSRWLYPIRSVMATGAIVAAGSDWSVTSMNPLDAIQVAVTRRALDDSTGAPFIAEERVGLAGMLRAYTVGGALASDQDTLTGVLAAGRAADLIVLSDDLFGLPPHRIHTARVLLTLLSGREVYRDSALPVR